MGGAIFIWRRKSRDLITVGYYLNHTRGASYKKRSPLWGNVIDASMLKYAAGQLSCYLYTGNPETLFTG